MRELQELLCDQHLSADRQEEEVSRLDPDLTNGCPPCGPFSQLMEWNYPRMDPEKARETLKRGLRHLRFTMRMFIKRAKRSKYVLFEQPLNAKSWKRSGI